MSQRIINLKRSIYIALFLFAGLLLVRTMPVHAAKDAAIESGYYMLVPENAPNKVLAIASASKKAGAKTNIRTNKKRNYQTFLITNLGGKYTIQNKWSGLYLSIKGKKTKTTNTIRQAAAKDSSRQKWYISPAGDGTYIIRSCYGKKALTVKGNKKKNKTAVYGKKYTGASGQRWKLVRRDEFILASTEGSASSGRAWNDAVDYPIFTNMIGAVESGGMVYGQRDYGCYENPYANSPIEHTITVGWAQFYGSEAQTLLSNICKALTDAEYKSIDPKGLIKAALKKNWEATHWAPTAAEKAVIIKLITTTTGKQLQDKQFQEQTAVMVSACINKYTNSAAAVHMYCQIRHLGGLKSVNRIFDRCSGDYSLSNILKALAADQDDTSSSNQVGDAKFNNRHKTFASFIQKYVV